MLYCKGCECIIVPGRAYLTSGGYYCPHCIDRMYHSSEHRPEMKINEFRGVQAQKTLR